MARHTVRFNEEKQRKVEVQRRSPVNAYDILFFILTFNIDKSLFYIYGSFALYFFGNYKIYIDCYLLWIPNSILFDSNLQLYVQ